MGGVAAAGEMSPPPLPFLFPGTSEGDKKAEKSTTDDKVCIILTLHP